MCEGASEQTLDLRILPRRDRIPIPLFLNSWIRPFYVLKKEGHVALKQLGKLQNLQGTCVHVYVNE